MGRRTIEYRPSREKAEYRCYRWAEERTVKDYQPAMSFDATVAASYDLAPRGDEAYTVAFLEQLAQSRRTLELAIGTGRIALPLAARGVPVEGIDLSPAMVSQLRSKSGGE